jgi:hypothetical protein
MFLSFVTSSLLSVFISKRRRNALHTIPVCQLHIMKKLSVGLMFFTLAFAGQLSAQTYFQRHLPLYNGIGYYNAGFHQQPMVLKFNAAPWTIGSDNVYCFSYPWCQEMGITSKADRALVGDTKYYLFNNNEYSSLPTNEFNSFNSTSLCGPWALPIMFSVTGLYYSQVENLGFMEIFTNNPTYGLPNANPQWNGYYYIFQYTSSAGFHQYGSLGYQPNFDRDNYSTYPAFPSSMPSPQFGGGGGSVEL